MDMEFLASTVRASTHRGGDDLLSAGLGLSGLCGLPTVFADPLTPTATELRRRAIQSSWKGIADLGPMSATGIPGVNDPLARVAWWADAAGVPPGNGVGLVGGTDFSADPTLPGLRCLRALWQGDDADARALHQSVAALTAGLPRTEMPIWVVHGADDGLLPTAFTSEPCVAWLREQGRTPRYWKIPHAQHFDAFLALPGFGDVHAPLLP